MPLVSICRQLPGAAAGATVIASIRPAPGLAAATADLGLAGRAFEQRLRRRDGSINQLARTIVQILAFFNIPRVVFHVLGGPAAAVGDEWELRQRESQLAEKREHLAGDSLDVVLTAGDDEGGNLVLDQHAVVSRDLILHAIHALGHFEIERAGQCFAMCRLYS